MARVIVLAGPSGAGKSRLASRLGLPILRLDDFYKDGTDPTLPHLTSGPNQGLVDWDSPESWLGNEAVRTLVELCEVGEAAVPIYEIAADGRVGLNLLSLNGSEFVVAEGIFAHHIVDACRESGILATALCVTQGPWVTFWRRLVRDLKERRKAPAILIRRGWELKKSQPRVVADAVAAGCTVVSPHQGYAVVQKLLDGSQSSH